QFALSRRSIRTLVHEDPALVQPPAKRLPALLRIFGKPRLQVGGQRRHLLDARQTERPVRLLGELCERGPRIRAARGHRSEELPQSRVRGHVITMPRIARASEREHSHIAAVDLRALSSEYYFACNAGIAADLPGIPSQGTTCTV